MAEIGNVLKDYPDLFERFKLLVHRAEDIAVSRVEQVAAPPGVQVATSDFLSVGVML